ncbi:MAG: hypothetical protein ACJATK_002563, partial [Paracoccaceae bacterium]
LFQNSLAKMTETNITDYYSALHLSINNYRGIYGKLLGENYWDTQN